MLLSVEQQQDGWLTLQQEKRGHDSGMPSLMC